MTAGVKTVANKTASATTSTLRSVDRNREKFLVVSTAQHPYVAKSSRAVNTIDATLPDGKQEPGLIIASDTNAGPDDFVAAIATHRHFARETDPPSV